MLWYGVGMAAWKGRNKAEARVGVKTKKVKIITVTEETIIV